MNTCLYLHGFQSGPQSLKARETRDYLAQHAPGVTLLCPQLSPYPARAVAQLEQLIQHHAPDWLIGSSLGGYYATVLAERHALPAILVNPAITPEHALASLLGPQHNPYTGEHYTLDSTHMAQLAAMRPATLHPHRYWVITGTADAVLDWRLTFRHYAGARHSVLNGDDHRLQGWPQQLPQWHSFVAGYWQRHPRQPA